MKSITIIIILLTTGLDLRHDSDCSEARSSAEDAYSYCKRAFDSDSWSDLKDCLKKAMNSLEEAKENAENCKCDEAFTSADDGYSYARKGYNSTDWEETKNYAKKAKNSADDVITNTNDCDN